VFSTRNAHPRIVCTARRLLVERPSRSLTIQDVADASGLSRRAVYNHFQNADELRAAVLELILEEIAEIEAPRMPPGAEPEAAVVEFVMACGRLMAEPSHMHAIRLLAAILESREEFSSDYGRRFRLPLVRNLESYLLHRRIRGEFRRCEPAAAAEQLVSTIEGLTVLPKIVGLQDVDAAADEGLLRYAATNFLAAHR
jgi:AcrR family transcriptional regulator